MESFFIGTTAQSRDYQERLCGKVLSMLDGKWQSRDGSVPKAAKSVLIEAPTGSGKTVVALALAQLGASRGFRIGFVAMRRNLLHQAEAMKDKFGFKIPNMRFISMFDSDPPTDVDWLIVDEAQHDSTDSMSKIHSAIQPKKVIGLSATPYRSDRAQLAFERIVRDVGIHTLIQDGYLSQFDHYTIPKYSPESIMDLFRKNRKKWGKSVIFFLTKNECDKASDLLHQIGIKNEVVWGGSNREVQIEAFRNDEVPVLISMSILSEGFDADDMKTVFIRPSSKLPAVQMGGRVLRKHQSIPFKQIVQCQDTRHPFIKTARARMSYIQVEDEFRSLSKNENIDAIAAQYARKVVQIDVPIPNFIKKMKRKSRRFQRNIESGE
jgi:superfamily II DNA or RNA helicase